MTTQAHKGYTFINMLAEVVGRGRAVSRCGLTRDQPLRAPTRRSRLSLFILNLFTGDFGLPMIIPIFTSSLLLSSLELCDTQVSAPEI